MLKRGFVTIPIHSGVANVVKIVSNMATSPSRMIVLASCVPSASVYLVVRVGICATAAPRRWFSLISKPYVYIKLSGIYLGVQWCGVGEVLGVLGNPDDPP